MGNSSSSQSLNLPYKAITTQDEAIKLLKESVYDPPPRLDDDQIPVIEIDIEKSELEQRRESVWENVEF